MEHLNTELQPITLEEALREGKVQVIRPEHEEPMPEDGEIRFDDFAEIGIKPQILRDAVKSFVGVHNAPIILDKFREDHASRTHWIEEIGHRTGGVPVFEFLKNTKLTRTKLWALYGYLELLVNQARGHGTPQSHPILAELEKMMYALNTVFVYNDITLEEKLAFVKQCDEVARRFLAIAKKPH